MKLIQYLQDINAKLISVPSKINHGSLLSTSNIFTVLEVELNNFFVTNHIKTIAFYGAGEITEKLLPWVKESVIIGIGDSNPKKWGQKLVDLPIYSPNKLMELRPDAVFIGSLSSVDDINKYLNDLKIQADYDFLIVNPYEISDLFLLSFLVDLYERKVLLR